MILNEGVLHVARRRPETLKIAARHVRQAWACRGLGWTDGSRPRQAQACRTFPEEFDLSCGDAQKWWKSV